MSSKKTGRYFSTLHIVRVNGQRGIRELNIKVTNFYFYFLANEKSNWSLTRAIHNLEERRRYLPAGRFEQPLLMILLAPLWLCSVNGGDVASLMRGATAILQIRRAETRFRSLQPQPRVTRKRA
jgi:hypothetical protein